jgi:hypothetical protein
MLVIDGIIDNKIRYIYNLLRTRKYRKANLIINNVFKEFKYDNQYDIDQDFLERFLNILSKSIIDMNNRQYNVVHNQIRDLHFEIYNKYL